MLRSFNFLIISLLVFLTSCKTFSKTQLGEAIGQKTGTALGSVVGDAAGNEVAGTMIGGSLGAATGDALVKSSLEKQADEIAADIHDASVRKTGEIVIIDFKTNTLFPKNNSAALSEKAKSTLDKLARILNKYPVNKIAFSTLNRTRNTEEILDEKRVAVIADYLRSKGIISSRIIMVTSDKNESKNRLISIMLS